MARFYWGSLMAKQAPYKGPMVGSTPPPSTSADDIAAWRKLRAQVVLTMCTNGAPSLWGVVCGCGETKLMWHADQWLAENHDIVDDIWGGSTRIVDGKDSQLWGPVETLRQAPTCGC